MTIYKVTQETWNGRRLADFDLPRTVGYYRTMSKATGAIHADIRQYGDRAASPDDTTDERDYRVTPVTVE